MSSFSFVIDTIRYSYSTLSGFETCPHSFYLSKVLAHPGENNFYAQYGTMIHMCMEKFFKGELESFELEDYFSLNYGRTVTLMPPGNKYVSGEQMAEKYFESGVLYFRFFGVDRKDWEVISIEDSIEFLFDGLPFIAKPDAVLVEKSTGLVYLVDYKSSDPFTGKDKKTLDKKKIDGYRKQLYVYAYALRTQRGITPDKLTIWFPRVDKKIVSDFNSSDEALTVTWIRDIIERIRTEEEFKPITDNSYFCSQLCGVRQFCEHWTRPKQSAYEE